MFEFVNYTYSGLISIIATLIGLAIPLIISRIEAIDKRYHSTLLTSRFIEGPTFISFACITAINLVFSLLIPYLLDESELGKWYIFVQSGLTAVLLASLLVLFYDMLLYTDRQKLQKQILADYHHAEKNRNEAKMEKYFNQWVDLVPEVLKSADDRVAQSVYDEWEKIVITYYQNRANKKEFDEYFLVGLTRINENICQNKRRLISISNGNPIVNSLLYLDMPMSVKHYGYLWKNLLLQVYYDRDEWLMAYWEAATQRYQLFVEQNEKLQNEKWDFLEFNIFFLAMLLQQNKYDLVKQILSYTRTLPESYPLVPSTISEILSTFNRIYKTSEEPGRFLYYESRFYMPNMYGINDGKILGAAYSYLALLMYRVYTLHWNYGADFALSPGLSSRSLYLSDVRQWEETLHILKHWLKVLKEEKNKTLLEVVNYSDDTIPNLSKGGKSIPNPDDIIQDAENIIKKTKENIKVNQPLSNNIVKLLNEEIVRIMHNSMESFAPFINAKSKDKDRKEEPLYCSVSQPYPRVAFLEKPDVSYVNIDETITFSAINTFLFEIGRRLYMTRRSNAYTISYDNISDAIRKLKLGERYVILSVGFSLTNIAWGDKSVEEINQMTWRIGKTMIYEIPCPNRVFQRMLYAIKKEDMPQLIFQAPNEEMVKKYDLKLLDPVYEIYSSILDLKDHPELHERVQELGEKIDEHSLLTLGWTPIIRVKNNYSVIAIKAWHKLLDSGNPDDIEDVKAVKKSRK